MFRRGCQQQIEADRAEASLLDRTRDQSHGLITEWSDRNEDRRVHPLRTKTQCDLGRGSLYQGLCVRDVAHEAIVLGCQCADGAFLLKLLPQAQREQMIDVAIDTRSDEAQVVFHAQSFWRSLCGNDPVG